MVQAAFDDLNPRQYTPHASWGYFDPAAGAGDGAARGDYVNGYQLPPVNWHITTDRKRAFFALVSRITGVD